MPTVLFLAKAIETTPEALVVIMETGPVSIRWEKCSERLAHASPLERSKVELSPSGYGIHWPLLDEDLAVGPLLSMAAWVAARGVTTSSLLHASFNTHRQDSFRNIVRRRRSPLDLETSGISKQISPDPIRCAHLDAKTSLLVVEPLADFSDSGEQERKAESDRPLVETLFAGAKAKPTICRHTQRDVDGEVLMGPKIVHDAAAIFADVGIKTASLFRAEGSHPAYGLSADGIQIGVDPSRPESLSLHNAGGRLHETGLLKLGRYFSHSPHSATRLITVLRSLNRSSM